MDRSVDALTNYENHATWWGYSGHIWLDLRDVKPEYRMTVTHGVASNLRLVLPKVEFGWCVADFGCGHTMMSVSKERDSWIVRAVLLVWLTWTYVVVQLSRM
jgi:hypothetical protein